MTNYCISKTNLFVLLGILSTLLAYTQSLDTQTVRGIIVDSGNEYPLSGANIQLLSDKEPTIIGASSDEKGRFTIEKVPLGRQSFICTYLEYKEVYLSNILVVKGKLWTRIYHSKKSISRALLSIYCFFIRK